MMSSEIEPTVVNRLLSDGFSEGLLFATANPEKQREIRRILPGVIFPQQELHVDEIQDINPVEVASKKAIAAWKENGYSPIIIEDTSLTIHAKEYLYPSTYVNTWGKTPQGREEICASLGTDKRATARVILAVFDGKIVHLRVGETQGRIAKHLRGSNNFGWDDMFIPNGDKRTFAEMTNEEKDSCSMRRKALDAIRDNPFPIDHYIFEMPEPYPDEITRIRVEELIDDHTALEFAYSLEALAGNEPNDRLEATHYNPIFKQEVKDEHDATIYTRYISNPKSPSLGLILTSISRARIRLEHGSVGEPVIYQIGPEQRRSAIAQRAKYFRENQNPDIHALLNRYESGEVIIPHRTNRRHKAIENALQIHQPLARHILDILGSATPRAMKQKLLLMWQATQTVALDQIGYRKKSSDKKVSRKIDKVDYLINKIGKYPRRIILGGSMPPATGGRDVLVTAALGHMAAFIPRNSVFAGDTDRQIALAKDALGAIDALQIEQKWKDRAKRNIGVSIGIDDPQGTLEGARRLYYEAGIRLFRIYTIGADPRVIETALLLRQEFGDEIEIFVGQVADKQEALQLIQDDIRVDAIFYGHGAGRQCTSAENGMAVTTLEEIYEMTLDSRFNDTTLLVEGGVGRNIGAMLILGVDGISYNQRIDHGTIESPAGDIFFVDQKGKFVQPYPGSASAEIQLIESQNPTIRQQRIDSAGRINTEGAPGFMIFERKSGGSMTFWINGLLKDASRMFADLGVQNIAELRRLVANEREEYLRFVSSEARTMGGAYGQSK